MLRVGNGDLLHLRIKQYRQAALEIEGRSFRSHQHNFAGRVLVKSSRLGQSRGFEFLRVSDVGGEKHVERRAVLNLGKEIS